MAIESIDYLPSNDPMMSHQTPDQIKPADSESNRIFEEILRSTLGMNSDNVEGMWDINGALKGKKTSSLEPIKEEIKMARKPRMRTVEQFLCDGCDTVIANAKSGFVVHGNIYAADPSQVLGLIGNNFPEAEQIEVVQVKKTVLCKKCFMDALGLSPSTVSRRSPVDDSFRDPGIRVSDR